MRLMIAVALVAVVGVSLVASGAGVRGLVQDKVGKAVDEHNQQVDDALGLGNANKPEPVAEGALKSGWLTRKSKDGKEVRLYFSYPAALTKAKPTAGLLVIQEWWGVNEDIQKRTQEFAAKGFYAVAPDLYYGKVTDDPAEAAKLKAAMTDALAMTAMKTGVDLFDEEAKNGVVNSDKVGVIGWCVGGQQALLLSLADPRIKATAIFYGPLVTDAVTLRKLQGPVLGVFGNDDTAPSPTDVEKFKGSLKSAGKDATIYQFDGVGHAFASKSAAKMGSYNEAKAEEAWSRTWAWLDKKLPR